MKASTQGAFKRPLTSFEETEPTRRRTMCDGRKMLPQGEENTSGNVGRVGTSVRRAALTARRAKKKPQVVRRLRCRNICAPFEDRVEDRPQERLLVADGSRQRLQGRPFSGRRLLLLARPTAIAAAAVK